MSFNSTGFLAFMAVVLAAYHALQLRGAFRLQNRLLLLASYVFYAGFGAWMCGLLAASTVVNFWLGRRLHRCAGEPGRRRWLWLCVGFNLGVLGFFKYFNFFADNLGALLGLFGMQMTWTVAKLVLPIGISFFTFQVLSYTIDIYRRRFEPVDDFLDFALFVAFFPQLVMGPIERAASLLPQIGKPRHPTGEQFLNGGWLIFLGIYKKVYVADQIATYCDPLFVPRDTYAGADVALGGFLFALQIYADFAGYADIARGSARMFGFELMTNFREPYFARNIQDYWNRWHISLSTWIRDYVYFPLAVAPRWRRLGAGGLAIVTMALMGLWHGASWVFVLWGLYHGVLLALYGRLRPHLRRLSDTGSAPARHLWHGVAIASTFALVLVGEVLFRVGFDPAGTADPLGQGGAMLTALFTDFSASAATAETLVIALKISAVLLCLDACDFASGRQDAILRWPAAPRRVVQAFMLFGMLDALGGHDTELGQRFQYFQF